MRFALAPYAPHGFFRFFRFLTILTGCLILFVIVKWRNSPDISSVPRFPPQRIPEYVCPCNLTSNRPIREPIFLPNEIHTESRALILVESIYSRHTKMIAQIFNATKYPHQLETFSKSLPDLITGERGRFSVIIVENYYKYLNMQSWNRQLIDNYSKRYNVTIIGFMTSKINEVYQHARMKGSNLVMWQNQKAFNLSFSQESLVPYIARPEVSIQSLIPDYEDWVLFEPQKNFETVLACEDAKERPRAAIIRDLGAEDGVKRILIGHNVSLWIVRLGLLDSLRFATQGRFGFSLDRWIQIDIDDIFVGARGTRMIEADVDALVEAQDRLRKEISNFTFMLGFSGSYFRNGDDNEDRADEKLIEMASKFYWFCHMFRHNHPLEHNFTYLEAIMYQNKMFAETMKIPVPFKYSISPQHAGVFPVYQELYDAWRNVWDVKVTATEEYPHLRPASDRRGFIYKGIQVLPRQTCGLYTHTQFFHTYPDGISRLLNNVFGGDLFSSVLLNPISIFMTHQQNFAHDRLAIWVFENLIRFLKCHTRLELRWTDPISSADRYFKMFPQEKTPIWSNPCIDARHRTILPPAFNCSNFTLPNVLIVGPQKTGTTALGQFLSLHPNASTNLPVNDSFEELQFFGGKHYENGLEWYIDKFSPSSTVFEKSATYFDNTEAPIQVFTLIPNAKIVVVLYDPALRAYSWFQHIKAHNDSVALSVSTMDEVLEADDGPLKKLRSRCISGGRYVYHLDRWLEYFPSSQMVFVDGEMFKERPPIVMNKLIADLELPSFDYHNVLRFSPSKGFWCSLTKGKMNCLGKGKGRHYEPMSETLRTKLNKIFQPDNAALQKILQKLHLPMPKWLRSSLYNTK
ncbi:unnamed protein product, partial [Mesorhabditis belari]|uniref:[heparan sulfate]-glucosamine N-sulfotransferase n=1 Tax=Mesorhabditis belari TaxID=2138241 RepID=A0AAF3EYI4_9BILA